MEFTVKFDLQGKPELVSAQPTKPIDWESHAAALQPAEKQIAWPENELIGMLTYRGYDYSSDTPMVSWFAPHSASVCKQGTDLKASVCKEIRLGWVQGPWNFVPTVSFRVFPSATIRKPRQPCKFCTTWNASFLSPHLAKSVVDNCDQVVLHVASNAAAVLPSYMAIAFLSIERVYNSPHILAEATRISVESLDGRSRDFAH